MVTQISNRVRKRNIYVNKVQKPCAKQNTRHDNVNPKLRSWTPECVENLSKEYYFPRLTNEFHPYGTITG